ncbi:hypothetical protein L596_004660 [Steinernema carpocapsae]|uniref:Hepatocyte growth factor-regulated tyrosine kinase substrate n=1 Tax=Steinernema carpocapsae TaxID=34508 RepID=A0A4U8UWM7_STECR|nr:hypothetical protein L596_004660 [Steinernema carpocapsae]
MAKRFERILDRATDSTLIEPNWDGILDCVDSIRGGEIAHKMALQAIQKRLHSENPHTAHHSLLILEACVKNCGAPFHKEVACRAFMDDLRSLATRREGSSQKVRDKVLELIQCWASAFKSKSEYKVVVDVHNEMKQIGVDFPVLREADAMFLSESAPEWADGDVCFRCRIQFGLITRKHHCRACGQVFCDRCSSKSMILPNFGIEKPVRVCDTCYNKRVSPSVTKKKYESKAEEAHSDDKEMEEKRLRELAAKDEENLARAIELSKMEAEKSQILKQQELLSYYNGVSSKNEIDSITAAYNELNINGKMTGNGVYSDDRSKSISEDSCVDSEGALQRYLDTEYWTKRRFEQDNKGQELKATAPPPSELSFSGSISTLATPVPSQHNLEQEFKSVELSKNSNLSTEMPDNETEEIANYCDGLERQVTVMDNRIRSNLIRGRSIINDTAIQTLFVQLAELHSDVMRRMNDLEVKRQYYEELQDRIAHISEARQAVNALREDYMQQKREREMVEQQARQREMQAKLQQMRDKKREMLVYERHIALQRFQQQEHEIQMLRMHPGVAGISSVQGPVAVNPQMYGQAMPSNYGYPSVPAPDVHNPTPAPQIPMGGAPQEVYSTLNKPGIPSVVSSSMPPPTSHYANPAAVSMPTASMLATTVTSSENYTNGGHHHGYYGHPGIPVPQSPYAVPQPQYHLPQPQQITPSNHYAVNSIAHSQQQQMPLPQGQHQQLPPQPAYHHDANIHPSEPAHVPQEAPNEPSVSVEEAPLIIFD